MMALASLRWTMPIIEEPGILAVHDVMHQRPVAVAMVLRRLHQADAGIGENRNQILQHIPAARHSRQSMMPMISASAAGAVHGDAQRAGLEAFDPSRH